MTAFPPEPGRYPSIEALVSTLARLNPLLRRALDAAAPRDEEYLNFAEQHCRQIVAEATSRETDLERPIRAYIRICFEHLEAQSFLVKHGRYAASDYDRVRREVYEDDSVMDGYYLDGLALTTVFWPNHYRLLRFFLERFVPSLPFGSRYGEMAVGPGVYMAEALVRRPDLFGKAFDLSAAALNYTERILRRRGVQPSRFALARCDVRQLETEPDGSFQGLVMGELLEHLPDPGAALQEAARVLAPDGRLFLTTAVNAGALDHIHLFRTTEEVRSLAESRGFRILDDLALRLRERSEEKSSGDVVPINYAAILQKSQNPH
jgi:SAM-dependent methyltransferase